MQEVDRNPALMREAFVCPSCGVFAAQDWWSVALRRVNSPTITLDEYAASDCASCNGVALWRNTSMVFPLSRQGEPPHAEMPQDVLAVYEEARAVSPISRKSAAGLLRLALQMLVDDLAPGRGTIDAKIGALVKGGLDPQVQQAMDVLRVVGNESVHPGQIDLDADDDLLPALFNLLNVIVEQVVARPKHIRSLFGMLPPEKLAGIEKRDAPPATEQP